MYYWRKLKVKRISAASCSLFQGLPGSSIFQIFVSASSFLLLLIGKFDPFMCIYIYAYIYYRINYFRTISYQY